MPRRFWEKVSHAVTSDRAGLAVLGVTAFVRAVSYAPFFVNTSRNPAHWLEGLLPAPAWSIVWLLIAVACIAAIITPRLLPMAVGMTVAINTMWALSFIGITITGESTRGYVSALGYAAVAFLTMWGFGRGRDIATVRIEKE